jgi:ABC-type polysaccharide/polyol phosphate export permease
LDIIRAIFSNHYLLFTMIRKDIRSRYIGSTLGFFWSIINPILMLLIFTFLFSVVFKIKVAEYGKEKGFVEFLICGFIPWIAFSEASLRSTAVIVENANFVKKLKFPSELFIVSTVLSSFCLQLIGFGLFILALALFGRIDSFLYLLLLPFAFILQILFTTGIGLILSCVNVFFRDVAQIANSLFTIWLYASPVMYPLSMVPEKYRIFLMMNPMTHLLEIYRSLVLKQGFPNGMSVIYVGVFAVFLLWMGQRLFLRLKPVFDDYL